MKVQELRIEYPSGRTSESPVEDLLHHLIDVGCRLGREVLVDVNKENIRLDAKIVEDLGAESLDIYDMIALLEDEFGTEISDEEVEKIRTVQDVADFIKAGQKK